MRRRGEDFQTSRVSAPSYQRWIREALKSPTFFFLHFYEVSAKLNIDNKARLLHTHE